MHQGQEDWDQPFETLVTLTSYEGKKTETSHTIYHDLVPGL